MAGIRKKVVHKGQNSCGQNGQHVVGRNGENASGESVQENRDELEYPFVEVASKKKRMNKSNGHVQEERQMTATCNGKLEGKMDDLHTAAVEKDKKRITPA
ncbi:Hypothetical predicted protein [Olea europaea subsp. europaea]|uniref:Uncharacterized protein n=1 Tax=Olea europaea subsp. europaea TaxID=158383 RepID=A0A8S0SQ79_OLEEU|nr:Hypothetical predicted protein [Olea europaea subsp. europaea]